MSKLYAVDIGFVEDTIIYELVPKIRVKIKDATLDDLAGTLQRLDAHNVLVESSMPEAVNGLKAQGLNVIPGRFVIEDSDVSR